MRKSLSFAVFFLISSCAGAPVNKPESNPGSPGKASADASYIFGSYSYEKRSPDLNGNDIGYLELLIEPVSNSGENPFYLKMEKDPGGVFLYPLKEGNYEIREMLLRYRNEDINVSKINGFFISVTNGEISYLGRITLFITSDTKGYITAGASSDNLNLSSDFQELGKAAFSYILITNANTILIPRKIYISGLGLMD
jgi:hypothetical protein